MGVGAYVCTASRCFAVAESNDSKLTLLLGDGGWSGNAVPVSCQLCVKEIVPQMSPKSRRCGNQDMHQACSLGLIDKGIIPLNERFQWLFPV
jgi:hypothetical protein